jgi:hypothetical protein
MGSVSMYSGANSIKPFDNMNSQIDAESWFSYDINDGRAQKRWIKILGFQNSIEFFLFE